MPNARDPQLRVLSLMGMCLLTVQQAERILVGAVETVLDHPDLKLMEQTESERKQTLGYFLKKLKRRVKIEPKLKETLYQFLNMRNTFVHDLRGIAGWDLKTEEGREVATVFLVELLFTSSAIAALFATLFNISAKEDFGMDLYEGKEKEQQLVQILEKHLGTIAREFLAGRYRKPVLMPRRGQRP